MSKKAYFMPSTVAPWPETTCDKCGLLIAEVQDGQMFWNPNKRAHDKQICANCYDVHTADARKGWLRWRNKHALMLAEKAAEETAEPPCTEATE